MLTDAGYSVPMRTYMRCWGYRTEKGKCIGTEEARERPPLAGEWSNPKDKIGNFLVVTDPKPGDIIAYRHQYANATGHVGIVSYPKSAQLDKTIKTGEVSSVRQYLPELIPSTKTILFGTGMKIINLLSLFVG
jgi:hypothetical protein